MLHSSSGKISLAPTEKPWIVNQLFIIFYADDKNEAAAIGPK